MQHAGKNPLRPYGPARSSKSKSKPSRPLLANQRKQRRNSSVPQEPTPTPRPGMTRRYSLTILALIPFTIGAWAMSIVVPTAYEAWRASEEIFVPRDDREGFADDAPAAPTEMPEAVRAALTATAQGTPATSISTPFPAGMSPEGPPTATPQDDARAVTEPTIPRGGPDVEAGGSPSPTETPAGPTATPYPDWNGDDPIHVLLLGVDTRPSEETEGRSDTMIVVRIDPEGERVDMFSIPRDLAVNIPGYASGVKINSAYPWGGPSLVAQTIEYNFGIVIDYYATVDIPGLELVVDTLGGVIVDVDGQLKDDQFPTDDFGYTRAYFPSGLQKLNGVQAVQFARTRHADGDFMRAQRQQQLLIALRDQALEAGVITRLPELISDLRNTIRTDLSLRQVLSLASLAEDIPREDIWVHSLAPYTYASDTPEGWFLIGDWDALRWVAQNLAEDPLAANMPGD